MPIYGYCPNTVATRRATGCARRSKPWVTDMLAPPLGRSGVLIAARFAFDDYGAVGGRLPETYRMVGAELGIRGAIAVLRSKPFTAAPVGAAV